MQQPPNDEQPYSQQVPPLPYQQPYYPPPMTSPPKKKRRTWLWIVLGSIAFLLFACIGLASLGKSVQPTTTSTAPTSVPATSSAPTQAVTQAPTVALTPTPTPQSIHYPPTTEADLRGLAAQGDASAIHEFHSERVGLVGVCNGAGNVEPNATNLTYTLTLDIGGFSTGHEYVVTY